MEQIKQFKCADNLSIVRNCLKWNDDFYEPTSKIERTNRRKEELEDL